MNPFNVSSVKADEKKKENNESPFYLSDEDILKHLITNDMGVVQIPSTVHKQDSSQPVSSNRVFPSIEEIAKNQSKNPIVRFFGIHFGESAEERASRKQAECQQREQSDPGTSIIKLLKKD